MKLTMTRLLGLVAAMMFTTTLMAAPQVAFPGAQGWGRWARGARAVSSPTVYHVTNLNDSGAGSFRDAVSQPGRIVVFDVSGVIKINSRIVFAKNIYVAGQTAPGEGITVYGDGVSFSGASDIICRYIRIRMGHGGSSGKDCAGIADGQNMIFDHCSFSWGLDETFSINAFGKAWCITLQNSIIGQGLMTHSAGGLMQADSITLYRNLYIDNSTRNNKVKGTNQYANNVVYNWSNGCYIMGGDSEGSSYVNIESNLFINGPSKGGNCFGGANSDFHCYGVDNWQDSNMDGIFDPKEVTNYSASDHRTTDPYDYPTLELYKGNELLQRNIPTVGASLPYRDQSDCYMLEELMSLGKKGALISNEESLPIGAPTSWTWWKGEKRVDTDGDGMPDAWETANGTDPNKADATVKAANGYLNIENYINSITDADRQYFLRQPITPSAQPTTSTLNITWRDYTYNEEGFVVSLSTNGTDWTEVGRTEANATNCMVSGLEPGTAYQVRIVAVGHNGGEATASEPATFTVKTKPLEVGMVDIDTYQPDVTNSAEGVDGKKLLLHTDETLALSLTGTIAPESVVATGKGVITVSGTGAIDGKTTTVNKGDEGTLVLNTKNTYEGATVLHAGVLEFNSIANGGEASAIGASQEFAQNWVMDGGTYRYTGGNATTNRSARLMAPTTLELKSATLTMSGAIEGQGDEQDFTIDGAGQLTVASTGFFAYTGRTILRGGNLYLSTTDITKAGIGKSSKLVLAGGTLKTKGESSNYETYSFAIEAEENTYSVVAPNRNCYFKSAFTGAGTIEYQIPYLREYFNANVSAFKGKIVANGINTVASDGGSMFMCEGSTFNMPGTQVMLKGTANMAIWGTNGTGNIGGLSGDATTKLVGSSKNTSGSKTTWNIGTANSDEEFRGTISDLPAGLNKAYNGTVTINKLGAGIWRLTGSNTYSGQTNVKGGTLIVNGKHTNNGNYTVANETTLKGKGSIAQGTITVAQGGTLCAGDTLINGSSLTLTGTTVSLQNGAILEVPVSYTTSVKSNNFKMGTLNIAEGAVLKMDMQVSADGVPNDTRIVVFAVPGTISGKFSAIEPAAPGKDQEWDTEELYEEGVIYVREKGYSDHRPTYTETNLMVATEKVEADGFYYFKAENDATSQGMIASGVMAFDAGAKSSLNTTQVTDKQTGAVRIGKGGEVIFAADGSIASFKVALYRSSGTDFGVAYASTDGVEWTLIKNLNADLVVKETQYVDLTVDGMKKLGYKYVKIAQPNSLAATFLSGVSITYMKRDDTALQAVFADEADLDAPCLDMQGRPMSQPAVGQPFVQQGKVRVLGR